MRQKGDLETSFLAVSLIPSLSQAETRAEFAERSVAKLEKTIDDLEETLASAKEENVEIHQTLDQTLLELNNL